jgi:hypothetical protein
VELASAIRFQVHSIELGLGVLAVPRVTRPLKAQADCFPLGLLMGYLKSILFRY